MKARSTRLVSRNVGRADRRTSMRLEPELWDAVQELCSRERMTFGDLVRAIDEAARLGSRTSAVRVRVLQYFRAAATEEGHRAAGHGNFRPMAY